MIGEPGSTVYGTEGPTGGPPVDPVMNPEGDSPLLLVRRETRQTVFAAVHEPFKLASPTIAEVRKAAASEEAYVAEVRAKNYIDRVALTFGEQKGTPVRALWGERDPQEVFVFRNYSYLREKRPAAGGAPRLVARGRWTGFRVRCPQLPERHALIVNGKNASYRKEGDYIVFGNISAAPEPDRLMIVVGNSLPEWVVLGREVEMAWTLRNTGSTPVRDVQLRLTAPGGCGGAEQPARADQIPAGGQWTARFSLRMPAAPGQAGATVAMVPEVCYTSEDDRQTINGPREETILTPPLEIIALTEPVRLAARDSREVTLRRRNWSPNPQTAACGCACPKASLPRQRTAAQ